LPSPDWPALIKRLPGAEASLLVLAAVGALAFHLCLPTRLPSEDDYRRLAEVVQREAQPGDAVLLHPWWTERARLFLPEAVPVVGYLDDDADPLESHPRVWVLAQPGLPYAGNGRFERLFSPHRLRLGEERRFGPLALSLYRNDAFRPTLFSAVDSVSSLRVYLQQPDGARADCPWDGRQYRCPGRDLRVAAEWHEVLYKPMRCLWMHPPGGAARLVAEVSQVPAGRLRLEAGIAWEHAWKRDANLTPLVVGVDDGQTASALARVDIVPGTEGLLGADAVLPAPTSVRLSTQSTNESLRDACVELRVLGPSAAEGP
jgi:hypothetical protein